MLSLVALATSVVVIGKVWQNNISRINSCPLHQPFWGGSGLNKFITARKGLVTIENKSF